jgi:hypothetical protein
MEEITFAVFYDNQSCDSAYKAVNAVNQLLKSYNLEVELKDDNKIHDGFEIFKVTVKETK